MSTPLDAWDPCQYGRFREERLQPSRDLLALLRPRLGTRVVDLGCGTGEPTRELHQRMGARETIGMDSSPAMLAKARALEGDGLRFELGEIEGWHPDGPVDVVFSNAALHWVPGHEALLERLTSWLRPEGQLAVQVPANEGHASHRVAAEVAREEPFRSALAGFVRESPVLAPEAYAEALHRLGFRTQQVRAQVYAHVLGSREDVVEWVKGTTLTAYERRLPGDLYAAFLERYRALLLPQLAATRPFLFTFRRVLFWGER